VRGTLGACFIGHSRIVSSRILSHGQLCEANNVAPLAQSSKVLTGLLGSLAILPHAPLQDIRDIQDGKQEEANEIAISKRRRRPSAIRLTPISNAGRSGLFDHKVTVVKGTAIHTPPAAHIDPLQD